MLARHEGVDDACEVTFSAPDKSQSRSSLCLRISAQDRLGNFWGLIGARRPKVFSQSRAARKYQASLRTASGERTTLDATSPARTHILLSHHSQATRQLQSLAPSARLGDVSITNPVDRQHITATGQRTFAANRRDALQSRRGAGAPSPERSDRSRTQLSTIVPILRDTCGGDHAPIGEGSTYNRLMFGKVISSCSRDAGGAERRGAFVNLGIALPHQGQVPILIASEAALIIVDTENETRLV